MGNLSNLYVSKSFQSLIHLGTDNVATPSLTTLQDGYGNSIGIEVNTAGDLFLSGSLTASLQQGYIYVGNASGKTSAFATSSLVTNINTGSLVTTSSFNSYTSSNNQRVSSLEAATSSYVTSAITASSLVTASAAGATITFTKGDSTQFSVTVVTGSVVSASYAETASLAINAKDIVVDVKNTTGAQINKGTVVRIIGATGDNPLIGTASWEDDNNSANTLGFVVTDIANDAFGRVMTQGTLLSVNTDPALGFAAGDIVYLSSSGQFTKVIPPAPYHEVRLGQVLRAQQNNGSIYVLVQNGYELTELHDVDINTGSLANNNLLAYNSASGQWENKTLTEVGATTTASFNAYTTSVNTFITSSAMRLDLIEDFTQSAQISIDNLNSATASLFTSASLALTTASVSGTTMTFTKGNGTTFNVTLPTGSGGSTINTGSFATTGSNSFNGDQNITGSARISSQLQIGSTNLGPSMQALDSGTPAGFTGLQINAGESGSFSMRTLYGGGIATATLEAYNTFPNPNSGGKISAKSGGGIDVFGYGGDVIISGSNTTIQGLRYPNTDGTNGQVITTNGSGILSFTTVSGGSINTGSFATTGSNTFVGNQTISGSILQSGSLLNELTKVQIAKSNKADFSEPATLLSLVGDGELIFDQYIDGGNFDTFNIKLVQNSGSQFRDYNGVDWNAWLTIPTNTGSNPSPIFTRGLQVTGSLSVSGSSTLRGNTSITGSNPQFTIGGTSGVTTQFGDSLSISSSLYRNLQGARSIAIKKAGYDYDAFNAVYTLQSSSIVYNNTDNLSATASYTVGIFDNAFTQDVELQLETTTTRGVQFKDIRSDTGAYQTFLRIAPNGGTNPPLEFKRGIQVTGSVNVSDVIQLAQKNPLPSGADGQLAVSGSNLYFFSGSAWNRVAFA